MQQAEAVFQRVRATAFFQLMLHITRSNSSINAARNRTIYKLDENLRNYTSGVQFHKNSSKGEPSNTGNKLTDSQLQWSAVFASTQTRKSKVNYQRMNKECKPSETTETHDTQTTKSYPSFQTTAKFSTDVAAGRENFIPLATNRANCNQ
jgi:hypothetical protein